jgi:hypothetical protein
VGYDRSTGQYALSTAGEVSYVDASEMFELLNRNQVIYVAGSGSIPKMTLWYGEDDEVFMYEGSNVVIDKITIKTSSEDWKRSLTLPGRRTSTTRSRTIFRRSSWKKCYAKIRRDQLPSGT